MKNLFLPLFFLFLSVTTKAQLSAGDILAGVKSHEAGGFVTPISYWDRTENIT